MQMKLEANDLYKMKIIDRIIYEDEPVTKRNVKKTCVILEKYISNFLVDYSRKSIKDIVNERNEKFTKY